MKTSSALADFRRMTPDELRRELTMKRTDYAKVRIHIDAQSEKNHAKSKTQRREIARMTMVLNQMGQKGQRGQEGQTSHKKTSDTSVTSAPPTTSITSQKASQAAKKPVKRASSKAKKS